MALRPNKPTAILTITSNMSTRTILWSTRSELLLMITYPSILLIGSLFSVLDPTTRSTPYSSLSQSHPPDLAPSYFAHKSNIFNLYFVKVSWAWITLAFFIFLFNHPLTGPRNALVLTPRRLRALLRYSLATTWWVAITQWFFGPAIIDRTFRWTGGRCELVPMSETNSVKEIMTGTACKIMGGHWKGGYDISGHVFILVLGSAFLMLEAMPIVLGKATSEQEARVIRAGDNWEWEISVGLLMGVTSMCWWMLLMTATYFHTWVEKVRSRASSSSNPSILCDMSSMAAPSRIC